MTEHLADILTTHVEIIIVLETVYNFLGFCQSRFSVEHLLRSLYYSAQLALP